MRRYWSNPGELPWGAPSTASVSSCSIFPGTLCYISSGAWSHDPTGPDHISVGGRRVVHATTNNSLEQPGATTPIRACRVQRPWFHGPGLPVITPGAWVYMVMATLERIGQWQRAKVGLHGSAGNMSSTVAHVPRLEACSHCAQALTYSNGINGWHCHINQQIIPLNPIVQLSRPFPKKTLLSGSLAPHTASLTASASCRHPPHEEGKQSRIGAGCRSSFPLMKELSIAVCDRPTFASYKNCMLGTCYASLQHSVSQGSFTSCRAHHTPALRSATFLTTSSSPSPCRQRWVTRVLPHNLQHM